MLACNLIIHSSLVGYTQCIYLEYLRADLLRCSAGWRASRIGLDHLRWNGDVTGEPSGTTVLDGFSLTECLQSLLRSETDGFWANMDS